MDQAEERVLTEVRGSREAQGKGLEKGNGSGTMPVETIKRKWHEEDKGADKEKSQDKGLDKGGKKRKGSQ